MHNFSKITSLKDFALSSLLSSLNTEYFLEDAIEMLHFIPPPQEKKKKPQGERDAYEAEEDVSKPLLVTPNNVFSHSSFIR